MKRGFLNVEWEKGVVLVWYYWHCFGFFFFFFFFNPSANCQLVFFFVFLRGNCQLVNERVKEGNKYVRQFEKKKILFFY